MRWLKFLNAAHVAKLDINLTLKVIGISKIIHDIGLLTVSYKLRLVDRLLIFNKALINFTEALAHWSNLIGAIHSKNYSIWEYGGYASAGLKELAEYGIIRTLEEEIKNHVKFSPNSLIFDR